MKSIKLGNRRMRALEQNGNLAFVIDQRSCQYMVVEIMPRLHMKSYTHEPYCKHDGYSPWYVGKVEERDEVKGWFDRAVKNHFMGDYLKQKEKIDLIIKKPL